MHIVYTVVLDNRDQGKSLVSKIMSKITKASYLTMVNHITTRSPIK